MAVRTPIGLSVLVRYNRWYPCSGGSRSRLITTGGVADRSPTTGTRIYGHEKRSCTPTQRADTFSAASRVIGPYGSLSPRQAARKETPDVQPFDSDANPPRPRLSFRRGSRHAASDGKIRMLNTPRVHLCLSVLVPCDRWYPCSGCGGLTEPPPAVSRRDREPLEHGYTDCTVTARICSVGATEVAAFLTDWSFLIEQHNSDASVRCDGHRHTDRLIRVGSV